MERPRRMDPISPQAATGLGQRELPAYISNGVIGLRVRPVPLSAGMALLNGFSGEDPERRIEAAAVAPYPLAGDIAVEGVWLSDTPQCVDGLRQAYDFACGELTSAFVFRVSGRELRCVMRTFASRTDPSLVLQDLTLEVDGACDLQLRAGLDAAGVGGRGLRHLRRTPGQDSSAIDGALLWESPGGRDLAGLAYVTELLPPAALRGDPDRPPFGSDRLMTTYALRARKGVRYRLRQVTSMIPHALHTQPDQQAARLAAKARADGFEALCERNRRAWSDLWEGRVRLVGAEARWQALADAAFFYLNTSAHPSAPASTSIFGLATWHDYHYYYGHVMWDIEAFVVPVLTLVQPAAAAAMLDYRVRTLPAARANAQLAGRRGLQFAWESAPSTGDEAAPLPGSAAWREDHVSLDVARAFSLHAKVTGDGEFLREKAWPVLRGVAEWLATRVARLPDGYAIHDAMGIAERGHPVDNPAYTNMSAVMTLQDAISAARRLDRDADAAWRDIAEGLVLPRRGLVVVTHEGFRIDEEKGATPDPLMGIWPVGFPLAEADAQATLGFYLAHADAYIGSPMLSALYGVWAARAGDRALSLRLFEEGYAAFAHGRFQQVLEYRPDRFPDQPMAGPFFANMGGFLSALLLGLTRLEPNEDDPETWPRGRVVLPSGWNAIEVARLHIRGRPMRLIARHGELARLEPL